MVDSCPPRYRRRQPLESTIPPLGSVPRPVDTRLAEPRQSAILSLSISPVKLLSVDDEAFVQAPKPLDAPSPHSFSSSEDGDEEAVGPVTRRSEEECRLAAVGGDGR